MDTTQKIVLNVESIDVYCIHTNGSETSFLEITVLKFILKLYGNPVVMSMMNIEQLIYLYMSIIHTWLT